MFRRLATNTAARPKLFGFYRRNVHGCVDPYQPPIPPLVTLAQNEKFRDSNGRIIDITTRGSRERDTEIYFSAADVHKVFGSVDPTTQIENLHYCVFDGEIYYTYIGMIRMMFNSNTPAAHNFQTWAARNLFALQMAPSGGVSPEAVRNVLNVSAMAMSGIYLLSLTPFDKAINSLGITAAAAGLDSPDACLYKFGKTEDIQRRLGEHQIFYASKGLRVHLRQYALVDPGQLSEAERDIRKYFEACGMRVKSHARDRELVCIDAAQFPLVTREFQRIGHEYASRLRDTRHTIETVQLMRERDVLKLKLQLSRQQQTCLYKDN